MAKTFVVLPRSRAGDTFGIEDHDRLIVQWAEQDVPRPLPLQPRPLLSVFRGQCTYLESFRGTV